MNDESCFSSNFFDREDMQHDGSDPLCWQGNDYHHCLFQQPSSNSDYKTFLDILNETQDVLNGTDKDSLPSWTLNDETMLSLEPRPIGPNGLEHVTPFPAAAAGPPPGQVASFCCVEYSGKANITTKSIQREEDEEEQDGGSDRQHDSGSDSRFRQYQQDQWMERFQDLLDFKDTYGHVLVPHSYHANQQLAQWVKRQRYQYKLKNLGRHSTLTDVRQQELVSVGFVWDSHQAAWFEKLESLKLFRLQKGHCNVPSKYARDTSLAIWVKCQRRQIKLFRKGMKSTMTPERFRALEGLGFDWNPRNF